MLYNIHFTEESTRFTRILVYEKHPGAANSRRSRYLKVYDTHFEFDKNSPNSKPQPACGKNQRNIEEWGRISAMSKVMELRH